MKIFPSPMTITSSLLTRVSASKTVSWVNKRRTVNHLFTMTANSSIMQFGPIVIGPFRACMVAFGWIIQFCEIVMVPRRVVS
jgi:hypothetical protein